MGYRGIWKKKEGEGGEEFVLGNIVFFNRIEINNFQFL